MTSDMASDIGSSILENPLKWICLGGWVLQMLFPYLASRCQQSTPTYPLKSATSTAPSRMTGCGLSVIERAAEHLRAPSEGSTSASLLKARPLSAGLKTMWAQAAPRSAWIWSVSVTGRFQLVGLLVCCALLWQLYRTLILEKQSFFLQSFL